MVTMTSGYMILWDYYFYEYVSGIYVCYVVYDNTWKNGKEHWSLVEDSKKEQNPVLKVNKWWRV